MAGDAPRPAQEVELEHEAAKSKNADLFAVFESGGKQHRVVCGETVRLERLPGAAGDEVSFNRVLMIGAGEQVLVGAPYVDGGLVTGEFVAQGRGKKIRVIKFKRRKNYLRHKGHRQAFSDVLITGIAHPSHEDDPAVAETNAPAEKNAPAAAPPQTTQPTQPTQ